MRRQRTSVAWIGIAAGVYNFLCGWQAANAQSQSQPEVIPCAGVQVVSIDRDGRTAVLITEREGVFGFDFETKALQQLLPAVQAEDYEKMRGELPLRFVDACGNYVVIVDLLEAMTALAEKGPRDRDALVDVLKRAREDYRARVYLWEHKDNVWRRAAQWTLDNIPFTSLLVPLVTEDGSVYIAHNDPRLRTADAEY